MLVSLCFRNFWHSGAIAPVALYGERPKHLKEVQDSTLLNIEGARQMAGLFVKDVKAQIWPLAKIMR